MSKSVLYDEPGPRTLRIERIASLMVGVLLLGVIAVAVSGMAGRGLFDDRWLVFVDPPKGQTAVDVWSALWRGLRATLTAAVVAAPIALAAAFALVLLRVAPQRWIRRPTVAVIEFLRGMPVLLMMFFGLLAFGLSAFAAVVFGLVVYNAAIMAEILRAGLVALPKGQFEAGTAIGLTRWQTFRLIQVPQVVRLMLPSLVSQRKWRACSRSTVHLLRPLRSTWNRHGRRRSVHGKRGVRRPHGPTHRPTKSRAFRLKRSVPRWKR